MLVISVRLSIDRLGGVLMNIEKLRQLKKDAGYTNKMISEESGVPLGTVQKIFSGETQTPRFKTLKAIENILVSASGYEAELQMAAAKMQMGFVQEQKATGNENMKELKMSIREKGGRDVVADSVLKDEHNVDVEKGLDTNSDVSSDDDVDTERDEEKISSDSSNEQDEKDTSYTIAELNSVKHNNVLHELMAGDIIFQIRQFLKEKGIVAYFTGKSIKVEMSLVTDDQTANTQEPFVCFPDVSMTLDKNSVDKDRICGTPDLIVEIMDSETRSKQLASRPDSFKNAGVKEYWMIDIDAKNIMAYAFEEQALPTMYGFSGRVPVRTAGAECEVNFAQLYGYVGFLFE